MDTLITNKLAVSFDLKLRHARRRGKIQLLLAYSMSIHPTFVLLMIILAFVLFFYNLRDSEDPSIWIPTQMLFHHSNWICIELCVIIVLLRGHLVSSFSIDRASTWFSSFNQSLSMSRSFRGLFYRKFRIRAHLT